MNVINAESPVDILDQTRNVVACLADLTSNCSGVAPQMSERGWSGFCQLLLAVETELSKLTERLEENPPSPFEKGEYGRN